MMKNQKDIDLSRRKLLAGTGLGAAALAAGVLPRMSVGSDRQHWDMEADIVCIGSGAAACTAAVTAAHMGDKVILLEKAPIFGGTTRRSGGVAWIPNNFSMRAQGVNDNEQDCMEYMCRYAYPAHYDKSKPHFGLQPLQFKLLQAFYRNGHAAVDTLQQIGATNLIRFELPSGVGPSADYAPSLPENRHPKGRSLWPDPAVTGGRGSSLVDHMINWLNKRGATTLTGHAAKELVTERDRVVGVVVEHQGKLLNVKARKGVIFGTGGFAHSTETTARFHQMIYGSCAASGSTGDLIGMAEKVGARLGNMDSAWRTQVVLEQALQSRVVGAAVNIPPADSMILVNKHGKRVVNEKRNYNDRTRAHLVWDPVNVDFPNQFLYMIFDQRALDTFAGNNPIPSDLREVDYVIQGETLAELHSNIQQRLDKLKDRIAPQTLHTDFTSTLQATINRYNQFAQQGMDADFKRGAHPAETEWQAYFSRPRPGKEEEARKMPNATMHPLADKGPYYAVILAPGALDTNAGPMIDEEARILSASGEPIPGLYGAGNCINSPTGTAYMGAGGTIGPAMTFGFIAARSAHQANS